jgi:hypothetical protein
MHFLNPVEQSVRKRRHVSSAHVEQKVMLSRDDPASRDLWDGSQPLAHEFYGRCWISTHPHESADGEAKRSRIYMRAIAMNGAFTLEPCNTPRDRGVGQRQTRRQFHIAKPAVLGKFNQQPAIKLVEAQFFHAKPLHSH